MESQQKNTDNHHEQQEHHDMSMQGVTRPQMNHGMETAMQTLQKHHSQTLWVYWMIILLGCWMILVPLTFSYEKIAIIPSGARIVWLSLAERIAAIKWSDIASGALLIFFGYRSLKPNRPVSIWVCCFTGVWLNIAPILFWAPNPLVYLNDTFVGALVIAMTILVAGMPNMILFMKMGQEVPKGWSYNPSSWTQRWIMIVLGFAGWMVSRYLAAFQLGFIDQVWDPFFTDGSRQVLNSKMSQSLFISDGALGALAYTLEFLMGWMGSSSRWRTMPWMVALFGVLVIPLGLVHIFLVIAQPIIVGAWCTFCLLAAAVMLPMIPLEVDEVIAMGQHIRNATKKGEPFWRVFWKGGQPVEQNRDKRSPALSEFSAQPLKILKASFWGMSFPRTLLFTSILGIWLMFSPAVFSLNITTDAADINHLCGAIIVVISVIAMGEVLRLGRYLNILISAILIITSWSINQESMALSLNDTITGLLVIVFSLPPGIIKERYGLWHKYIH